MCRGGCAGNVTKECGWLGLRRFGSVVCPDADRQIDFVEMTSKARKASGRRTIVSE